MTQTIKTIAITIIALVSITISPISTSAQTPYYSRTDAIVEAPSGLNVRGNNCEVLDVLPHQSHLFMHNNSGVYQGAYFDEVEHSFANQPTRKTCTINGRFYMMILVSKYELYISNDPIGYVAEEFLAPIRTSENLFAEGDYWRANAPAGLNVRGGDCQRVATVPNNYLFNSTVEYGIGGTYKVCEVNGEYYDMLLLPYNSQWHFVAAAYVK